MTPPRVVLAFDPSGKHYLTQVASGIFGRYSEGVPAEFELLYPRYINRFRELSGDYVGGFDGIISGVRRKSLERLKQRRQPLVTVGPEGLVLDRPWVGPDYRKVAEEACRYFASRGYQDLVYFSTEETFDAHSNILRETLQRQTQASGMHCHVYRRDRLSDEATHEREFAEDQIARLTRLLHETPMPCALIASDDDHAWLAAETCRRAGFRVPEDVSILGVRSDDYLCELSTPALSHVYIDYNEVGRVAVDVMLELLAGRPVPLRTYVGRIEIRERASSIVSVHRDPIIGAGIRYMEAHLAEPITVVEIAAAANVSRRTLLRHFNNVLAQAPTDVLRGLRADRAKQLLHYSTIPLVEVALKCGLSDQSQLNRLVRDATGKTPAQFRRECTL